MKLSVQAVAAVAALLAILGMRAAAAAAQGLALSAYTRRRISLHHWQLLSAQVAQGERAAITAAVRMARLGLPPLYLARDS